MLLIKATWIYSLIIWWQQFIDIHFGSTATGAATTLMSWMLTLMCKVLHRANYINNLDFTLTNLYWMLGFLFGIILIFWWIIYSCWNINLYSFLKESWCCIRELEPRLGECLYSYRNEIICTYLASRGVTGTIKTSNVLLHWMYLKIIAKYETLNRRLG